MQSKLIHWTDVEDDIIRKFFGKENVQSIAAMLPQRTVAAINNRAYMMRHSSNNTIVPKRQTIEQLEADLQLRKAQADLEAAEARYKLFRTQSRAIFSERMKNDDSITMDSLFALNSKEFGKHNAAISAAHRKLLRAEILFDLA